MFSAFDNVSFFTRAKQALFGVYETEFESRVRQHLDSLKVSQKKRLGAGKNYAPLLQNLDGFMWTGEIYLGANEQKMDVVFDTGSEWLVIEGKDCKTCDGDKYDIQPSIDNELAEIQEQDPHSSIRAGEIGPDVDSDFKKKTKFQSRINSFGDSNFKGGQYLDKVCILPTECFNFKIFYLYDQKGIWEPIDGILGMARPRDFFLNPARETEYLCDVESNATYCYNEDGLPREFTKWVDRWLLTDTMFQQKLLNSRKYSFHISPPGGLSWVDLGVPNINNLDNLNEIVEIQFMQNDFFYSEFCQGIAFGDTGNKYSWGDLGREY